MAGLLLVIPWLLSSTDINLTRDHDLTQAGSMNYLLPHLARDFAPLPTVKVPSGHGMQLVFIA